MGTAPFQPIARRRAETATARVGALAPLVLPVTIASAALALLVSPWFWSFGAAAVVALLADGAFVAIATRVSRGEPHPWRLRALVGVLFVLQPFARTWGRLRGTPLSRPAESRPHWSGDRVAWLRSLELDLMRHRCKVRPSDVSDPWDLRIAIGLFVAARLTTAVTYGWIPQASVRYSLRLVYWLTAAGALAFGAVAGRWAWNVFVMIQIAAALEFVVLRARVTASVERTSAEGTS